MNFHFRFGATFASGCLLGGLAAGCADSPEGPAAGAAIGDGAAPEAGAALEAGAAPEADDDAALAALPAPTVLASGQEFPVELSVDAGAAYWVSATDFGLGPSAIRSTPKAGGGPVTDVLAGVPEVSALDVAGGRVFVGVGAAEPGVGGVQSAPAAGGPVADLLGGTRAFQVAIEGSTLYVASPDAGGRLLTLPASGGPAATLAEVGPGLDNTPALALGGDKVFFTQSTFEVDCDGKVSFVPKAGGAPVAIAAGICGLLGMEADAHAVYWAQWDAATGVGKIVKKAAPFGAGTPVTLAELHARPTFLALDPLDVYYVTGVPGEDGRVRRVSKFGGRRRTLAAGQEFPTSVAVDKHHVYWTTFDGGVKRVAK